MRLSHLKLCDEFSKYVEEFAGVHFLRIISEVVDGGSELFRGAGLKTKQALDFIRGLRDKMLEAGQGSDMLANLITPLMRVVFISEIIVTFDWHYIRVECSGSGVALRMLK